MPIYFFYPCDSIESLYSNLPFVSLLTSPSRFNLVNSNWMIILGNFSIANIQPERRPSDRHVLFPGIIAAAERLAPPLEKQRSQLWLMKLHHDYKELKDQGIGATPESFSSPMPQTGTIIIVSLICDRTGLSFGPLYLPFIRLLSPTPPPSSYPLLAHVQLVWMTGGAIFLARGVIIFLLISQRPPPRRSVLLFTWCRCRVSGNHISTD